MRAATASATRSGRTPPPRYRLLGRGPEARSIGRIRARLTRAECLPTVGFRWQNEDPTRQRKTIARFRCRVFRSGSEGGFTHSCRRISAVVLVPRALSRLFAAQRSGWSLAANGRFALLEILRMYQLKKLFFRMNAELTVNVLDMGTSRSLRYHKFFANVLSVISCCQ